jgi:hypothetical protein
MAKAKVTQDGEVKLQTIPLPITPDDKVELLDRLVILQKGVEADTQNLIDLKAEHKETQNVLVKEIANKTEEADECLKAARNEQVVKDIECRERKNFNLQPALLEFVHPEDDDMVFYSRPLHPAEFVLNIGDWAIGDPATNDLMPHDGIALDDDELVV